MAELMDKGKGTGKGKGAPRPPPPAPKAAPKVAVAPAPQSQQPTPASASRANAPGLGDAIEVVGGPAAGLMGTVLKVSGEGDLARWKVELTDGARKTTTWVSAVILRTGGKQEAGVSPDVAKTERAADFGYNTPTPQQEPSWRRRARVPLRRHSPSEVTEEGKRAAEAKMRAKASEQQRVLAERRAHYASLRPCDIADVPWAQAQEINYVDGGSGGVLFLDLGEQCVVLKPQRNNAASELLAQHLAPLCGVHVAQCRIVRHDEEEHGAILSVHVDGRNTPIVGADDQLVSKIFKRHKRHDGSLSGRGARLFGVLEYVPGHPLMGMLAQETLTEADDSFFLSLGRLCALDVLINNMDRIPLPLWGNDGNLGNVMLSGGSVVGIDQQINPILAGDGLRRYVERIERLVVGVQGSGVDAGLAKHLNDSLEVNAGLRLADAKVKLVQQGLHLGLEAVARSFADGSLAEALEGGAAVCKDRLSDDPSMWDFVHDPEKVEAMATFVTTIARHIAEFLAGQAAA